MWPSSWNMNIQILVLITITTICSYYDEGKIDPECSWHHKDIPPNSHYVFISLGLS